MSQVRSLVATLVVAALAVDGAPAFGARQGQIHAGDQHLRRLDALVLRQGSRHPQEMGRAL